MATTERGRRTTAGKRMNFLSGQALEDDAAFWAHDTWESDNESFRSADQDDTPDVFDSDFNETEESSDEEQETAEAEKDIAAEEQRMNKKQKATGGYNEHGGAKLGRFGKPFGAAAGGAKKTKGSNKRIVGGEHNAGIVLNLPVLGGGSNGGAAVAVAVAAAVGRPRKAPTNSAWSAGFMDVPALAARRERRSAREASGYSNEAREAAAAAAAAMEAQRKQSSPGKPTTIKPKVQETFQQADLLLEAVNETEPSNERWLLGRKRNQAEKEMTNGDKGNPSNASMYTEKFVSRRGYLNTINFADMDRIPTILLQQKNQSGPPKVPLCAITGKPARYRDPKSGHGYYDLEAFRAIRAKWEEEHKQKAEAEKVEAERVAAVKAKKQRAKKKVNGKNAPLPPEIASAPPIANETTADPSTTPLETPSLEVPISTIDTAPAVKTPNRRPGRPKGTSKKRTAATIAVSATSNPSAGIAVSNSISALTSTAAVSTTTPSSNTADPAALSSSLLQSATIPPSTPPSSSHRHPPPSPLDLSSSRKSPRRRKPSARMLESIDEGLLPAMPESSTPNNQASSFLEPRHDG